MADTPEVTPLVVPSNIDPPKRLHAFCLIIASCVFFIIPFLLSDLIEGVAMNGLSDGFSNTSKIALLIVIAFGLAWLIYVLPLNLLVLGLYRWRRWRRYRTQFVLGPSLCIFGIFVVAGLCDWPTARREFKAETGMPLPASAQDLHSFGMRSLRGELNDIYFFRCDPLDAKALIETLHLDQDKTGHSGYPRLPPKPDWPDAHAWKGTMVFTSPDIDQLLFYTLVTDENKNQVYLYIMTRQ